MATEDVSMTESVGLAERAPQSDRLLSAEEVARMIGMTTSYVYDLSRRGRIPTITFGRQRRYRKSAVLRWLEEIEGRSVR